MPKDNLPPYIGTSYEDPRYREVIGKTLRGRIEAEVENGATLDEAIEILANDPATYAPFVREVGKEMKDAEAEDQRADRDAHGYPII